MIDYTGSTIQISINSEKICEMSLEGPGSLSALVEETWSQSSTGPKKPSFQMGKVLVGKTLDGFLKRELKRGDVVEIKIF
jgi:hypothetical protein